MRPRGARAGRRWPGVGLAAGVVLLLSAGTAAGAGSACEGGRAPVAEVVAVSGAVTRAPAGGRPARLGLGAVVCPGDRIRTGDAASVELRFAGADTIIGAAGNTTIVVPAQPGEEDALAVLEGCSAS
jgi:hypothetical protein